MRNVLAFLAVLAGAASGLVSGFWVGIVAMTPLFCAVWSAHASCPPSSNWYGVEWVSILTAYAGAAVGAALIARLQGSRFLAALAKAAALSAMAALATYVVSALGLNRWGGPVRLVYVNLALSVLLPAIGARLARR